MGVPDPSQYKHLENVLFVTSRCALDTLGATEYGKAQITKLQQLVGERLWLVLPGTPANVHDVKAVVREWLMDDDGITGVVILGDYACVPARRMRVISPAEMDDPAVDAEHADPDSWIVWNDDLYGDRDGDTVADVPVSRLPIVPQKGGILGDENRDPGLAIPAVGGLRSFEFDFADDTYFDFLEPGGTPPMRTSPEVRAFVETDAHPTPGPDDIDHGDDFAAECLYLPLHSYSQRGSGLKGAGTDVVTLDVLGADWETRGVTFAGACYGALVATPAWYDKLPPETWTATDSVALSFLDRGADAFVGFTALHYVPEEGFPWGDALHCAFWKNIVVERWPPAKALHEARLRFMADIDTRSPNPYLRAIDLKTFWSATCLGVGWQVQERNASWLPRKASLSRSTSGRGKFRMPI